VLSHRLPLLDIAFAFTSVSRTRGNDPYDLVVPSVTVADDEHSQLRADAEQDEPILVVRMVWIVNEQAVLVREDALRLLERNAVLPDVGRIL
jgi:hypothetical protein